MAAKPSPKLVRIGEIVGVHGVKGWLKLHSYTDPIEQIFAYRDWYVGGQRQKLVEGVAGRPSRAQLDGIVDRDQAVSLIGKPIEVDRSLLPALPDGEYYWFDLEGLSVTTESGVPLGHVKRLFSTGANDVLVVYSDRERLIPWVVGQYVKRVDLEEGQIVVDWDPEF